MKIKSKVLSAAVILLLMVGCQEERGMPPHSSTLRPESRIAGSKSETPGSATTFSVENEINLTEWRNIATSIPILETKVHNVDMGIALELFQTSEDPFQKIPEQESDSTREGYISKSGKLLTREQNRFTFVNPNYLYMNIINAYRTQKNDYYNANRFIEPKDFMFGSADEFLQENKKLADQLNIQIDNTKIYYLDHEVMEDELKNLVDTTGENLIPEEFRIDEWTENDDAYAYEYRLKAGDLLLTNRDHGDFSKGSLVEGSALQVIRSQDGILSFTARGLIDYSGIIEKPQNIIGVDEALQRLDESLDSIFSDKQFSVKSISLEYIGEYINQDRTQIRLIPAWCFEVEHKYLLKKDEKDEGEWSSEIIYIDINAITGKEML